MEWMAHIVDWILPPTTVHIDAGDGDWSVIFDVVIDF